MDEIDMIRKRIAQRRQSQFSETEQSLTTVKVKAFSPKSKKKRKGIFFKASTSLLLLASMTLGTLVYMRKDENGKFLKHFNINVNFAKVNQSVGKYLDNILNFNLFNSGGNKTATVDKEALYVNVNGDIYTSGTNRVASIDSGTVVYSKYINGIATIIIQHDSGFQATYTNIDEMLVSSMDRVGYNDAIGVTYDTITIYFSKDGVKLTYEEALQLIK